MPKLATRTSLLILLCLTIASDMMVYAETSIGVSEGDVFEYDMVLHWTSVYTSTPPPEVLELNQTERITVEVTEVSGSLISSLVTTRYKNGTETTADGFCQRP